MGYLCLEATRYLDVQGSKPAFFFNVSTLADEGTTLSGNIEIR